MTQVCRIAVTSCTVVAVLAATGCQSSKKAATDKTASSSGSTAVTVVASELSPSLSTAPAEIAASATSAPPPATSAPPPVAASGSTVATDLDPCQLVTSSEASALAGTTFGSGQEEKDGNTKRCTYGAQTLNVFTVEVAQAANVATAQAAWAQEEAEVDANLKQKVPAGVSISIATGNAAGIGDQAASVFASTTIGGQAVGISGIYVLKGATFFAFQDFVLGKAPPAVAALEGEAKTVLGRV